MSNLFEDEKFDLDKYKITSSGRMYIKTEDFFQLKRIKELIQNIVESDEYKEIAKEIEDSKKNKQAHAV